MCIFVLFRFPLRFSLFLRLVYYALLRRCGALPASFYAVSSPGGRALGRCVRAAPCRAVPCCPPSVAGGTLRFFSLLVWGRGRCRTLCNAVRCRASSRSNHYFLDDQTMSNNKGFSLLPGLSFLVAEAQLL